MKLVSYLIYCFRLNNRQCHVAVEKNYARSSGYMAGFESLKSTLSIKSYKLMDNVGTIIKPFDNKSVVSNQLYYGLSEIYKLKLYGNM